MKNFKKLSRNELKTVKAGEKTVWFAETSCGVQATTTQDWDMGQANDWLEKLEAYYCEPASQSNSLA